MAKRERLIHLRLSETEEKIIKENATRLNMEVRPYIRMVAQNPTIIQNNYAAIEEHTKQIGMIDQSINLLIYTFYINNDYLPKEIEAIANYMKQVWETENKLLDEVRKQWTKEHRKSRNKEKRKSK